MRLFLRTVWLALAGLLAVPAGAGPLSASAPLPPLPIEAAGHARISTSAEMSAYLAALAAHAPDLARREVLGTSVLGRPVEALVLGVSAPQGAPRLRVMIVGSQHGAAEPAGGEALLELARDLVAGELRALLDDLDVMLIPNANPDGRDLGRRSNAVGVNLNTDFVLLGQPENRALRAALTRFAPHAVLDAHESAVLKRETLAREGYLTDFDAQFEIANNPAVPPALRAYALDTVLPDLTVGVTAGGLPAHRYIGEITRTAQPITNGGLTARNFRNTAGLTGALSVLVETRLDPRTDPFPTYRNIAARAQRQRLCLRAFLAVVHARRADIAAHTDAARAALAHAPLTLHAQYVPAGPGATVDIPLRRLDTRALETLRFADHRRVRTADTVPMPAWMAVTAHTGALGALLTRHGIAFSTLTAPAAHAVLAARYAPPAGPAVPGGLADVRLARRTLPAGTLVVDTRQPGGRMAVLLLDPRSTSSAFRYPDYAVLAAPGEEFFVYAMPAPGPPGPPGPP